MKEVIITKQTSIPSNAFKNMVRLENVELSNLTTSISSYAFENVVGLKSFFIPASVNSISDHTFTTSNLTLYTELLGPKTSWGADWNSFNLPINWGYTII